MINHIHPEGGAAMAGLVHLYCGDGKGKTTAAVGLAVRAAGAGRRVLFTQFFKNGDSSEISVLRALENVEVFLCPARHGFFRNMDGAERADARRDYSALLEDALGAARRGAGLLVLDEAVSACNYGVIEEEKILDFLRGKPAELEVVLTGRDPSAALLERADYATEMKKLRHPYDRGVRARRGIEF